MQNVIEIDGGAGGGQVLRAALALSVGTGRAFRITKIRGRRPRPGLMRQHLTAVKAAAMICGAETEGAEFGSSELFFRPGPVLPGHYEFDIGSGGSTVLVMQALVPGLMRALRQGGKASLTVTGGTVCPMAPPFAFLKETLEPHLRALGWPVRFSLVRHGFYQNGGGILRMEAEGPFEPVPLCADTREPVLRAEAEVLNVGLPQQIADREVKVILRELAGRCSPAQGPKVITDAGAPGTANAVLIRIRTKTQTYVFSETGSPTVSAENVAKKAAADALVFLSRSVPVPSRLADQLLVPMALSAGGRFLTTRPSAHTRSCAEVVGRFLEKTVLFEESDAGWLITVPALGEE